MTYMIYMTYMTERIEQFYEEGGVGVGGVIILIIVRTWCLSSMYFNFHWQMINMRIMKNILPSTIKSVGFYQYTNNSQSTIINFETKFYLMPSELVLIVPD